MFEYLRFGLAAWLLVVLVLVMGGCKEGAGLPTAASPPASDREAANQSLDARKAERGRDHRRRPSRAVVAEAKDALGALLSSEQVYYQRSALFGTPTFIDIANAEEARARLGIDLDEPSRRWAFSVTDASETGFVATARGQARSRAAGIIVSLRYVRGQPFELSVQRRRK